MAKDTKQTSTAGQTSTASAKAVGDRAPAFTLLDHENIKARLTEHKGERVFLFFYPKAMTPG